MTRNDRDRVGTPSVMIVSHGFGYGNDLMYFGEIFRCLRTLIPSLSVAVDADTSFNNRYGIALKPMMRLRRRSVQRATPDGQVYPTEIAVPAPSLFVRLLREPVQVFVTIEFTAPALMTTLAATLRRRTGLVLLVESDPAARGGSTNPVVRQVKRWVVSQADVIQTNNEGGRRYLVEDLRARPEKVRVAPYLTSRPPGPNTEIQRSEGPLRLLFANSITQRKGLREFLQALSLCDPGVRAQLDLVVVGDGPDRAELATFAEQHVSGARISFAGRQSYADLGHFYAAAEVLVIPSLADYRSLAGFEGLGYGLALLASSRDGATAETVIDGENGYVIDPANAASVAARVSSLVQDREQVLRMREASLKLYRERFSLEQIAANIADSVKLAANA
ncbi:glycosyltransferase family 4 protein [Croceibacterium sp. TMG7-5b_MA50]|uniref:glycosyltransferase family 4 protein n=1 Tax=Croceibacterium sp. TMG7-5b_MA50 TaxID=3121290 RepID=UPI003221C0A6